MFKTWKLWSVVAVTLTLAAANVQAEAKHYFGKDTDFVVHVNVRQMLNSKLFKDNKGLETMLRAAIEEQIRNSDEAVQIRKALGIDFFRDLDTFTFAGKADPKAKEGVAVITGRFKMDKFASVGASAAREHPNIVKVLKDGGTSIYQITPQGNDGFCLALADKKTLVMAFTPAQIKAALKQGRLKQMAALRKDLKTLLAKTKRKQSVQIVVSKNAIEQGLKQNQNPNPMVQDIAKQIQGVLVTATVAKEINFNVGVDTKTADEAKKLANQTTFGLMFANQAVQQQAQNNPALAPIVDIMETMRANSAGSTMNLTGRVPGSTIRTAMKLLEQFSP